MVKSCWVAILSLIMAGIIAAQDRRPCESAGNLKVYTLSNGLQVVLQSNPDDKDVSIEFWLRTGARDEAAGKYGFAHFFEHATPWGPMTRDKEIIARVRKALVNSNAHTDKDYINYFIQLHPDELELGIQYAADRFRADQVLISGKTLEYHRKNVLAEIDRQESNVDYSMTLSSAREAGTFGPDHPYGHSTYGTREANAVFSSEEVARWYQNYVTPSNAILFVVGRFDRKQAKKLIAGEFLRIPSGPSARAPVIGDAKTIPSSNKVSVPIDTPYMSITWGIPAYRSKPVDALQLLAAVLEARLKERKNAPDAIVESGSMGVFKLYQFAGEFGVFAKFKREDERIEVEKYLRNTIADVFGNGVSDLELRKAREYLRNRTREMCGELGFVNSRTLLIGEGVLYANDANAYVKRLKRESRITAPEVRKAALEFLKGDGSLVLALPDNPSKPPSAK